MEIALPANMETFGCGGGAGLGRCKEPVAETSSLRVMVPPGQIERQHQQHNPRRLIAFPIHQPHPILIPCRTELCLFFVEPPRSMC